jgi:hypothetical protein
MGLLDDAIREHLDLKRRRGADPDEVQRAEREALGPVRRGREESEEVELTDDDAAVEEGSAYDHEEGQDWADGLSDDEPEEVQKKKARKFFGRKSRPAPEPEFEDEPVSEPQPRAARKPPAFEELPAFEEPSSGHESGSPHPSGDPFEDPAPTEAHRASPAAPESGPVAPAPSEPASAPAGGETVEYDVERALEENKTEEGDDVLEETPEFLQDTPDHDRLWFEQRPPRDFDFDG